MFENPDVAILNRLGKLQNSVNETENIVSSTSKETTSQEILATVKNSGGGGLLPVYVTGSPTHRTLKKLSIWLYTVYVYLW